jgi:hypothetical protein
MLLMASMENKESDKEEAWFLDSGCSNHMCGTKEVFYDLDENFSETVKLGNNSSMVVKGKGYVRFQLNGISHIITSVFYVPDDKNFYGIFSISISNKLTKTSPNTKENLQKWRKASRQSKEYKKTRKSQKSEDLCC